MSVSIRGLIVPTKLRSGDWASYLTVATKTGRDSAGFSATLSSQPVKATAKTASEIPAKSLE
jgi:hypothetical protein